MPKVPTATRPATWHFYAHPEPAKDYLKAGLLPADQLRTAFAGDLLSDVAAIRVTHRLGDHMLAVYLTADDLTEDEQFGTDLVGTPPGGVITRAEARRALIRWQARTG